MSSSELDYDRAGKAWPAICVGGFVAFGGVLFGYDTGKISGILPMEYFKTTFSTGHRDSQGQLDISPAQVSIIVSILSAGTFLGSLASPLVADRIGRRFALLGPMVFFFTLGVALQIAATALPLFLAGRFFAGFGVGLLSAVIPLYQSETAPKWIHRQDSGSYRIPIGVQFGMALIILSGGFCLPETPRFLIMKGRVEKAHASLAYLRRLPVDHPAVKASIDEIQANYEYELSLGKVGYLDCFKSGARKRQLTGMSLHALQQLSGINFIFYFGTSYFKNSGIKNAFTIQVIVCVINVVSTVPGLYGLDKIGRKPLLIIASIGMTVSQLLVALLGTLTTGQDSHGNIIVYNVAAQKAGIAFVASYLLFYAAVWGPSPWVVCGEIFPLKTRARSLSMTTATNWLLNWALAFSTPYLVNYGEGYANLQSKIFFIWFAFCALSIVFVYFFIYETKGLSLEDIDQLYHEVSDARNSIGWKPRNTFIEGEHAVKVVSGAGGTSDGEGKGDQKV